MLLGLDHLIVAATDLGTAGEALASGLGLDLGDGGRHPALGTRNRLAWWGDSYLELVAVEDAGVAGGNWFGAAVLAALGAGATGAGAEAVARAPVGLALASDDLAGDAASMGLAEVTEGQRSRPDGRIVRWRMARAVHCPEASEPWPLVFLIEHDLTAAEWTPADRHARALAVHPLGTPVRLRSVTLGVPLVPRAVARLGREFRLAFRPSLAGGGARDASVGDQILRLVAARGGEPRVTIELRGGHEPRHMDLLGCRWRYVPA